MKLKDLIRQIHHVNDCSPQEHEKLAGYIRQAYDFSRISAAGILLVDFSNGTVPFATNHMFDKRFADSSVSGNYHSLLLEQMNDSDINRLIESCRATLNLIHLQPIEKRKKYTLSTIVRMSDGTANIQLCCHGTPVALTENGKIWLTFGTFSPSANFTLGSTLLRGPSKDEYYSYSFKNHNFKEVCIKPLSTTDRNILLLSSQGYSVESIASILYKSADTIRTHKRNLFKVLGVKTIIEAVVKARNLMLF